MPLDHEEAGPLASIGDQIDTVIARTSATIHRNVRRLVICRGETAHDWGPEMYQERDPYSSGRDYDTIVRLREEWYSEHPPTPTGAAVCARCGARRAP